MKQTVVEWLVDYIENQNKNGYEFHPKYNIHIVNKAKEMQEQQIKTAYGSGIETMRKSFSMSSHIPKGAQEYYNETFNK